MYRKQLHPSCRVMTHVLRGGLKCFDIFSSNRIFLSRGKRPRGVQPAQICLCLIKGCNFLFISGPLPPTPSSRLLIPPLQNAPTVPPNPGALLLVSCLPTLQPAPLRAGVWGGDTLCVSRLVAERQQILIVPRGSGDRGGGWEGWRRHRCLVSIQSHTYTHVCMYIAHTRACEGTEGFRQLQAWDQSPSRAQVALTQPLPS